MINLRTPSLAFLALSLLSIQAVLAHYRFDTLITQDLPLGSKSVIRQPKSWNPMLDSTSKNMTCNFHSGLAPEIAVIKAGSDISFKLDNEIFHPGPGALYLGAVPEGESAGTWDGSGARWVKIKNWGVREYTPTFWYFELTRAWQVNATIPAAVPSGEYLLRAEHIGLIDPGKPQFYVSCAQVKIVDGGEGRLGPFVEIPGHFLPTDPGLQLNLLQHDLGMGPYRVPGPDPWEG
ncbi:glycosyl hydrolase family 61-domain-containing protein [Ephemerocybe angulata]|uniref:lytic cellulose monooxygenase (C4-dehydrogenating) n=1 Tax=Ephemerocybe angulata TaxID=980116 RepID=A0A8H6M057_9AGAR|nr:glycosyl hydrolase family 61-domain-containing protein [Tulosesus angulatus]